MFSRKLFCCLFTITLAVALVSCGEWEERKTLSESGSGKSSHNAGGDCVSCHSTKYAGTVYMNPTCCSIATNNPVVVITEKSGQVLEIVADNSGNFYTTRGDPSQGYTATIKGNAIGMVTKPTGGACSSKGCHDGEATPRVYIN
jgi:hypothetical protein